ncbi:hypothetical protein EI94DRAFT_889905 [Lactarius quietus]|nr:hypothetical protein EI94DRAFT_889905 [Lactarius quietus]
MPENDGDGDSFSLSALLSGQSVDLAASSRQLSDCDLEGDGGDCSADMDAMPPPLGAKLTGYRLAFMTTVFIFGTLKTILAYMGQSTAPNALDWASGTFLTVILYWIGLYEDSNKWKWFFKVDCAPAIGYFAKCVAGGII